MDQFIGRLAFRCVTQSKEVRNSGWYFWRDIVYHSEKM